MVVCHCASHAWATALRPVLDSRCAPLQATLLHRRYTMFFPLAVHRPPFPRICPHTASRSTTLTPLPSPSPSYSCRAEASTHAGEVEALRDESDDLRAICGRQRDEIDRLTQRLADSNSIRGTGNDRDDSGGKSLHSGGSVGRASSAAAVSGKTSLNGESVGTHWLSPYTCQHRYLALRKGK